MPLNLFSRRRGNGEAGGRNGSARFVAAEQVALLSDPLERALQTLRFGRIMQPPAEWQSHHKFEKLYQAAAQAIDDRFGLVPDGYASVATTISEGPGAPEEDFEVEPFLLARHPVTNAEYQMFVDDGGYEELELWPEETWPHVVSFKDFTGHLAPRFWREGRHDKRLARHPVVGVCYYEASAYARWAGYRLPTTAEWQMAASWRVRSSAHVLRRYPWGDGLDLTRCNIWASGHGATLPVDAFPDGAAPNGVLQLIGNVWEWTESDFTCTDDKGRSIIGEMLMKVIRGGAFDTYFPWQATSTFYSGMTCLMRMHNVGIRCALDLVGD